MKHWLKHLKPKVESYIVFFNQNSSVTIIFQIGLVRSTSTLVAMAICSSIKVNGYTFRGSNSAIFILTFFLNGGLLLKEKICSYRSKFFPLRVDPIFKRLYFPGKQTERYKSYFPL